ncbi:MAG: type IV pilus modification protein PilV [Thiohalomonadaceae bacterium]
MSLIQPPPHGARGFTLMEVMIALVILSVGLLGLAGMQMVGLISSGSTSFRGQAIAIANDLAERMHANPGSANDDFRDTNDDGSIDGLDNIDYFSNLSSAGFNCNGIPNCGPGGIACSPQQMAVFDFAAVACGANSVGTLLPGGTIRVECLDVGCPDGSLYRITVSWTESRNNVDLNPTVDITVVP